jgi:hypothetical protein
MYQLIVFSGKQRAGSHMRRVAVDCRLIDITRRDARQHRTCACSRSDTSFREAVAADVCGADASVDAALPIRSGRRRGVGARTRLPTSTQRSRNSLPVYVLREALQSGAGADCATPALNHIANFAGLNVRSTRGVGGLRVEANWNMQTETTLTFLCRLTLYHWPRGPCRAMPPQTPVLEQQHSQELFKSLMTKPSRSARCRCLRSDAAAVERNSKFRRTWRSNSEFSSTPQL